MGARRWGNYEFRYRLDLVAAAAAVARGVATFPVEVRTPAGPIALREESGELFLTGPAVLIGEGEFWLDGLPHSGS